MFFFHSLDLFCIMGYAQNLFPFARYGKAYKILFYPENPVIPSKIFFSQCLG